MMRWAVWTLCLVGLLVPTPAALGGRLESAGDREHAWVFVEQVWRGDGSWDLYHASASAPPGALSRVMTLGGKPLAVVASERQVFMVFPARGVPGGGSVRPVRSVSVLEGGVGGMSVYQPSGRAGAEAALPGSGVLVGAARSPDGPAVVLRDRSDGGPGRLLVLNGTEWEARALPVGLDTGVVWRVRGVAGGMLVETDAGAWVWDDSSGWRPVADPLSAGVTLLTARDQLLAASWAGEGGLSLQLVQGGKVFDLATVSDVPSDHTVVGLGETAVVYWFDLEEENRLRAAVVSSISGELVYEGFAGSASPLKQEDLQFIALVAGSVLMIVVLFLIRPEGELHREPVLPEGTALAEPSARFFAAVIDVFPAALVSSLLWKVTLLAAVSPGLAIAESSGLSPIFLTAALYFLHSALGDWMGGRTIGKRLMGCRTVDASGRSRLRLRQALVRNLFKAVFPPLTMLLLLDPSRRHPADQVAGTIVVSREREVSGGGPPEG